MPVAPVFREIHGKLRRANGRLPSPSNALRVHLENYTYPCQLPSPEPFDWRPKVPATNLGMDGNDVYGDCVAAWMAHILTVFTTYGPNRPIVPTTAQTLATYHAIGGPGDNGLDPDQACNWWTRNPFCSGDQPVRAWAVLDHRNTDLVLQAGGLFGGTGYSLNLPSNFEQALNAGQPWTDVTPPPNPTMGHEMYVIAADEGGPTYWTWGQAQKATWAWHNRYGVDCRVVLSPWWLMGSPVPGVDVAQLETDFQAISGQPTPPSPPPIPPSPPPPPIPPTPARKVFSINFPRVIYPGSPVFIPPFRAPTTIAPGSYDVVPAGSENAAPAATAQEV